MTSYCSIEDLFALGLKEDALFSVDRAKIEQYLSAASRKMDSYLRGRGYTVPLVDWGDDVTQCCAAIAAWDLLRHTRGVNPDDAGHMALAKAQADALLWLRDVAKGIANFSGGDSGQKRRMTGVAGLISVVDGSGSGCCGVTSRGW